MKRGRKMRPTKYPYSRELRLTSAKIAKLRLFIEDGVQTGKAILEEGLDGGYDHRIYQGLSSTEIEAIYGKKTALKVDKKRREDLRNGLYGVIGIR